MIQMNNSGLMTIDQFNKLTGHEMLHSLICMIGNRSWAVSNRNG